ncbi:hypothetical protein CO662_36445 [Rhizobium anhuiense]|uniref:Uncharacterized protein n=3 Tax=Rhizobium TaxID=379 RepID=B3Q2Y3_RHIE6|nr:hypothetical protein RHECIAT_PB0000336 [Rhizobium etli CIAT 652]ANL24689.1 hypothetical protein AMJ96_PB00382 [Rhizobium sp. N113]ANL50067.1 hypothetical protein AMC87_PC00375 [Rhizobium phaseoli]ARQ60901.1 IS21 family insertion sequence transposase domain-containing protein [Rhizobium sp. Kim5]KKZ84452.1 hypothetical protein RPHASCH2410_PC00560 [Rhizobium phaseoli Ch24-10]PCK76978.1 hypothetical protein CPT34_32610 [Rhizobium sophoriradicis]PDS45789.1 hypothetical protein CO662_36445 [Rhi
MERAETVGWLDRRQHADTNLFHPFCVSVILAHFLVARLFEQPGPRLDPCQNEMLGGFESADFHSGQRSG